MASNASAAHADSPGFQAAGSFAAQHAGHGRPRRIVAGEVDRTRAFRRARFHTMLVRLLRIAFPVAALACLGVYLVAANLSFRASKLQVKVGAIEISSKDLKMTNPHMEGATSNGGRYAVTAKSATQDLRKQDVVRLSEIDGMLTQPDRSSVRITAPSGVLSSKRERLDLAGPIAITGSDGLVGRLQSATMLMKSQFLFSKRPVQIEMTTGRIDAQRFNLNARHNRAFFAGDVFVHLLPQQADASAGGATAASAATAGRPGAAPSGPVDIRSERLTIFDKHKRAYFRGGATAVQGEFTLQSRQLLVRYSGNATPGARPVQATKGGGAQVRQIEASGDVVVTALDGRTLKGDTALFDNAGNTLKVDGSVVLKQEGSELEGTQLTADLGQRVMELVGEPRIKARLRPAAKPGADAAKAKPSRTGSRAGRAVRAGCQSGDRPGRFLGQRERADGHRRRPAGRARRQAARDFQGQRGSGPRAASPAQ